MPERSFENGYWEGNRVMTSTSGPDKTDEAFERFVHELRNSIEGQLLDEWTESPILRNLERAD